MATTIRLLTFCLLLLTFSTSSMASGDLTAQKPIEVRVMLGDKNNHLKFYPDNLQFETGRLFKLVIHNPSKQKHYFSSPALARSVFTRKVEVLGSDHRTLAEVKGSVNEIELYPGGTAEWWFVPVKTLSSAKVHCTIKGHTEAGMIGRISVK